MVEYSLSLSLDNIFSSLADPTRRDILRRVSHRRHSIGELARHYPLTFAAVSKHIKVLEDAKLVTKRKKGKEHIVHIAPQTLAVADEYLEHYRALWDERFGRLDALLKEGSNDDKSRR